MVRVPPVHQRKAKYANRYPYRRVLVARQGLKRPGRGLRAMCRLRLSMSNDIASGPGQIRPQCERDPAGQIPAPHLRHRTPFSRGGSARKFCPAVLDLAARAAQRHDLELNKVGRRGPRAHQLVKSVWLNCQSGHSTAQSERRHPPRGCCCCLNVRAQPARRVIRRMKQGCFEAQPRADDQPHQQIVVWRISVSRFGSHATQWL